MQALRVREEAQVLLALRDLQANKEKGDCKVSWDLLVHLESLAVQETLDHLVQLVKLELLV